MHKTLRTALFSLALAGGTLLTGHATATAAGRPMLKKDLVHTVSEQVKAGLPAQLLLDEVQLPKGFAVPHGSVVEVKWRSEPAEGNAWVLVSASIDETVVRRAFVKLELVAIRNVLVAQRDLAQGDTVRDDDLLLEPRVGATGVQLAPHALVGAPVLSALSVGDVVTPAAVGLPAPIARGTSINVISEAGRVRVVAQARLETTARPGESASARVIRTRVMVHGELVDEHTLLITDGGAR